jgi:hypothetical protein
MASKLEALAKGMREAFYAGAVGDMEAVASRLESPLEAAVFWALVCRVTGARAALDVPTPGLLGAVDAKAPAVEAFGTGRSVTIWPQLDVKAGEDVYRVDLALLLADRKAGRRAFVVVELDGHDFHDRTKEQAERDRRRDRNLQALGWRVARFTGSQAHRGLVDVVEEILGFAEQVAEPAKAEA